MSIITFALLSIALSKPMSFYDAYRDFSEGTLTAYERVRYKFPIDLCFNETTQSNILESAIDLGTYASFGEWSKVAVEAFQIYREFTGGLRGCDTFLIANHLTSRYKSSTAVDWWIRLLTKREILMKYCTYMVKDFAKKSWKEEGYDIGSCLHYILPPP